ncbi:hypothetical protein D3C71_1477050 [compost metagenome]
MYINSQTMPETVHEILTVTSLINDSARCKIYRSKGYARFDGTNGLFIGFEYCVVYLGELWGRFSKGKGPGDIRSIAIRIYANVVHKQVAILQFSRAWHTMWKSRLLTRKHHGVEGGTVSTQSSDLVLNFGYEFILRNPFLHFGQAFLQHLLD